MTKQIEKNLNELTPTQFGIVVAAKRKELGWSQQFLGEKLLAVEKPEKEGNPEKKGDSEKEGESKKCESARVIISRIENCTSVHSKARMDRLCKILGIQYETINSQIASVNSYATTMSELTKICSKLTPVALDAVLAYAKQFAEYGKEEKSGKPST